MERHDLASVICDTPEDLAGQAAADACEAIKSAIAGSGRAVVLFSAGTGQDEFYEALMAKEDVDWTKVIGVPDAELVGKSAADDTSAGAYLQQKVVAMVAEKPFKAFHIIDGKAADIAAECARLSAIVAEHPIDVALLAIGENGEFGGNQLPADTAATQAYAEHKGVIAMSVQQILKAKKIICAVPGKGRATVCKNLTEGTPGPNNAAALLQTHADASVYMDKESSHLLKGQLSKGQVAAPAAGRGFVIRTFRPGQGWIEMGNEYGRGRNLLTGKLDPMAQRKLQLEKKRAAAAALQKRAL